MEAKTVSKLTDRQKDQIAKAMDLVVDVIREIETTGKNKRVINALDKVSGELYNLIWS